MGIHYFKIKSIHINDLSSALSITAIIALPQPKLNLNPTPTPTQP